MAADTVGLHLSRDQALEAFEGIMVPAEKRAFHTYLQEAVQSGGGD